MYARSPALTVLVLSLSGLVSGSTGLCGHDRAADYQEGEPGRLVERHPEARGLTAISPDTSAAMAPQPSAEPAGGVRQGVSAYTSPVAHPPGLDKEHHCLSLNVYWEARNQSLAGQLAVAQVTVNRSRDPRFPADICEVVYDHKQFSWYWDGKSDWPVESGAWELSRLVASAAMDGTGHADLQGVTHYHAVYVQPYWRDSMTQVTIIGDHIFYLDSSRANNVRPN